MRWYYNVNLWISDRFDSNFAGLVFGDRCDKDVEGVLSRLQMRHLSQGIPEDVARVISLFDLAAHYAKDSSQIGVKQLVLSDTRRFASEFYSKGNYCNEDNWSAAQDKIASSIDITKISRIPVRG